MSAGATALLTGIDEMRRTPSSRDKRMIGEPRRWKRRGLGGSIITTTPCPASSVAPGGLRCGYGTTVAVKAQGFQWLEGRIGHPPLPPFCKSLASKALRCPFIISANGRFADWLVKLRLA